jgi:prepilin-type processing-associated H-X9-DG protein
MMMYVQDHDEMFPTTYVPGDCTTALGGCWSGGLIFWPQLVASYTKSINIYTCPDGVQSTKTRPYSGHYGASKTLLAGLNKPTIALAMLTKPAETMAFCDAGGYAVGSGEAKAPAGAFWYIPGTASLPQINRSCAVSKITVEYCPDSLKPRHSNGNNVTYADGHVKWVPVDRILDASLWSL